MTWRWPLPGNVTPPPTRGDGAFGAVRKHEVHTGVDLYCKSGQPVEAVAAGRVIAVVDFTGERAGSPWWFETRAVIVDHGDGCVLYGEVDGCIEVYRHVEAGDRIGYVWRVRRKDDGLKPTTMLHLELWRGRADVIFRYSGSRATDPNDWPLGGRRPAGLLDPTAALVEALRAERERA